jgi:16S rRNA (guanine527-N7)-methyltransferase
MEAAAAADLSDAQRSQLAIYLTEFDGWNQRTNLTAVPAGDRWRRHVVESLHLAQALQLAEGAALIDIGSGPGVPGLVIAVARPDVRVTLLDGDSHKTGFLTHVAGVIGLRSLVVVNRRAEEAGHDPELRERFDIATARALARPAVLCELTLPFVRVGGTVAALVVDSPAVAREASDAAALLGGGEPESRPGLLLIPKTAQTPARFPRRPGVPARRPLG